MSEKIVRKIPVGLPKDLAAKLPALGISSPGELVSPGGVPLSEVQYQNLMTSQPKRDEFRAHVIKAVSQSAPELVDTERRTLQRRRAMHFMPAHEDRFLTKVAALAVDTIIFDLEDSVPQAMKAKARSNLETHYSADQFRIGGKFIGRLPNKELCIRINFEDKKQMALDLDVVRKVKPDLVLIPKAGSAADVAAIRKEVGPDIELAVIIETVEGFNNAREIIGSGDVTAVVFGAEDFYAELSTKTRLRKGDIVNNATDREQYLGYARPLISLCIEHDVQFIDSVHSLIGRGMSETWDAIGHLQAECNIMHREGIDGKLSVHPSQIRVIQRTFDVSPTDVNEGLRQLETFNVDTAVHVTKDGLMQDTPEVRAAKRIARNALRYL